MLNVHAIMLQMCEYMIWPNGPKKKKTTKAKRYDVCMRGVHRSTAFDLGGAGSGERDLACLASMALVIAGKLINLEIKCESDGIRVE